MWSKFYERPRLLILALLLIFGAGATGLQLIPRSEDPRITNRYSFVITRWPGASAERVETLVTERIEQELLDLDVVRRFRSVTNAGISSIELELKHTITDVEKAWSRVRDRMNTVAPELPQGVSTPYLAETEEADAYTMLVALTWTGGEPVNYAILRRLAKELESQLRFLPGTEYARLFGAPEEEILVEVDTQELAAIGLEPSAVARQVAEFDPKNSAGLLRAASTQLPIEVSGELDSLEQLRAVPLRRNDSGHVLTVGQVAEVSRTTADPPSEVAYFDGVPGVGVGARMAPGIRVDRWSAMARGTVEGFAEQLSPSISLEIVYDQSEYVEASMGRLVRNLIIGVCFVVVTTLLVMGWRSAILVGIALPLSALMVMAGMFLTGVTVHQISIMGLILSLGLLIDNAIIMVDEVRSRLEKGANAIEAINGSCRHLAMPLFGSTLTTVLAFSPLLMLSGGVGDFLGDLGITVVLSLVSSFVLAITILPALTVIVLRKAISTEEDHGWYRTGLRPKPLKNLYGRALDAAFRRPVLGIIGATALPLLGFVVAGSLQQQFFPPAERDQFVMEFKLSPQTSLQRTRELALQAREVVMEHPDVERVDWFVGGLVPRIFYNLTISERQSPSLATGIVRVSNARAVPRIIETLQPKLDKAFPQAQTLLIQLEQGEGFKAPVELRLQGPDLEVLHRLGTEARAVLAEIPEVIHTQVSLTTGRPKVSLDVDETKVHLAGLSRVGIAESIESSLEGQTGGSIVEGTEELPVVVRVSNAQRGDLSAIASLDLVRAGEPVPLTALGDVSVKPEFSDINHNEGERCNNIYGYLQPGVLPAAAVAKFKDRLAAAGFQLPPGYSMNFGGEQEQRQDALADLLAPVFVLVLAMLGTLVLSFNSFRLAAVIGTVGVLSIGLGLAAVWVFGYPLGFMAIIGTLGLVGVAINDSIVVLANIRADEKAREGDRAALRDVVMGSTRHVITTSLTTIAGFTPLYLAGGMFWPPLAVAIAGGVAGATLLALFYIPSIYLIVYRKRFRRMGVRDGASSSGSVGPLDTARFEAGV